MKFSKIVARAAIATVIASPSFADSVGHALVTVDNGVGGIAMTTFPVNSERECFAAAFGPVQAGPGMSASAVCTLERGILGTFYCHSSLSEVSEEEAEAGEEANVETEAEVNDDLEPELVTVCGFTATPLPPA